MQLDDDIQGPVEAAFRRYVAQKTFIAESLGFYRLVHRGYTVGNASNSIEDVVEIGKNIGHQPTELFICETQKFVPLPPQPPQEKP